MRPAALRFPCAVGDLFALGLTRARSGQLLDLVWEHDYLGDSRLVDACVQRLWAKIETDTAEPRYIQTVRGFGHRFGPV